MFPFVIVIFMAVHFWRVRKDGGISGPAVEGASSHGRGPRTPCKRAAERRPGRAEAEKARPRPAERRRPPAAGGRPAAGGGTGRSGRARSPPTSSSGRKAAKWAAAAAGGGGGGGHGTVPAPRPRRRHAAAGPPEPAWSARAATPSASSPSSRPARSRTSRPRPPTRCTCGPTCWSVEFVASLAMTAFLLVFSTFVNAPLLGMANFNLTPNPSKAPWYFLGLQELLTMFHPMVAGVTIPGMGLIGLGGAGLHRQEPQQQAGGPEVRHRDDDAVPDVLGRRSSSSARSSGARASTSSSRGARASTRSSTCEYGDAAVHRDRAIVASSSWPASCSSPRCAGDTGTGHRRLGGETAKARPKRQGPSSRSRTEHGLTPGDRQEVERAAALERARRRRPGLAVARPVAAWRACRSTTRPSASPAGSSSTAASRRCSRSAWPASAPPASPSCGPPWPAASGRRSRSASSTTSSPGSTKGEPFYVPEGRFYLNPYPPDAARRPGAKKAYSGAVLDRHGDRRRRPVPEVRAPRLPGAVVQELAVVRVPVPRLEVQPGG